MAALRKVYLPAQPVLHTEVHGNPVRQLLRPAEQLDGVKLTRYVHRTLTGEVLEHADGRKILVLPRKAAPPASMTDILLFPTGKFPRTESEYQQFGRKARWLTPSIQRHVGTNAQASARCAKTLESWRDQFFFVEEQYKDGTLQSQGLRPPQVGAIYASLSHWTVGVDPANIVMPTGTGKTETMLALLVKQRFPKLLVVVPTDPLRDQIGNKFFTLGVLKTFGVIGAPAEYPVVCLIRRKPQSKKQVEDLWSCANVLVTTMAIAGSLAPDILEAVAARSSLLMIDEAHHVSAPSWLRCRDAFKGKPVLQFTATPFRGDGKHVDGKPIFNYPLRKAQAEGYFKRITFRPITAYDRESADIAIARSAVTQLDKDLKDGFDHLIMARAASIDRAEHVHSIYQQLAPHHSPLLIHNRLPDSDRRNAIGALNSRNARIIVCVDMLGEGFDLPELKIAALHDMHKSLAITLQFTGRFTRSKASLGDATMIANVADATVEQSLQDLYAEDADWNVILRQLSEGASGKQAKRSEFLSHFEGDPPDVPVQNIFPAMSTVAYHTYQKNWHPERFRNVFKEEMLKREPALNRRDRVLAFVTRELERVPWGDVRDIQNLTWHLYLLHWDADRKLLFINSSNNDGLHEELAKEVCGDDVSLVRGEDMFRCLHGMRRILLTNLGLNHSLSRAVRFTWYVGADIVEGLSQAHLQNKTKSNIFGRGYEHGTLISMGCSRKGRVWSHRVAGDIQEWVEWCHATGKKLLNTSISFQDILPHVIKPERLEERPNLIPLVIEWSEKFLDGNEDTIMLDFPGTRVPFLDVGIGLVGHDIAGPIRFRIFTEHESVEYEVRFSGKADQVRVDFVPTGAGAIQLSMGKRSKTISEWFQEEPPVIRFANGDFLIYNELCSVNSEARRPFANSRIDVRDWTGVDFAKESQTVKKLTDSIQYRVIQEILGSTDPHFDIVLDDDDANEAADIVALGIKDDKLLVHLYHCKFSKEDAAGARVKDLYEVCGQAQRSVFWKGDVERLLTHLARRDARRVLKHNVSRFERGDPKAIANLKRRLPYLNAEFRVIIVQPGLSRAKADDATLDLLAATELYLKETFGIPLSVIGSA